MLVNNQIINDPNYLVKLDDEIIYNNQTINSQPFKYFLLNKPKGYVCANKDQQYPCVIDLFKDEDLFCLGRLDKDTTGLLIVSDDKSLVKNTLLPQNHIEKTYLVTVKNKLDKSLMDIFKNGVVIDNDVLLHSSKLEIIDDYHCYVTIDEGKYHQIKKMFLSNDNEVIELSRIRFKNILLDESLSTGEYRSLTNEEIEGLLK